MKVVVLLSAGWHPASDRAVLPKLEAQAIRLGSALGALRGLHAGPDAAPASDGLGHGLSLMEHLQTDGQADPVPVLAAALASDRPDLILAGRRSQGQDETGLVPYALARALAMPLVADAIAIVPGTEPNTLVVDQALPKGAVRRLTLRLPAIVTVHPGAPPPLPFAYGPARRGMVRTLAAPATLAAPTCTVACDERPYRPRPKMMRSAPAGASAMERLKAATGDTGRAAHLLVRPEPEVAAREILAYLRTIGVVRPPVGRSDASHQEPCHAEER